MSRFTIYFLIKYICSYNLLLFYDGKKRLCNYHIFILYSFAKWDVFIDPGDFHRILE